METCEEAPPPGAASGALGAMGEQSVEGVKGGEQSDPKEDDGVFLLVFPLLLPAPPVPSRWPNWTSLAGVAAG